MSALVTITLIGLQFDGARQHRQVELVWAEAAKRGIDIGALSPTERNQVVSEMLEGLAATENAYDAVLARDRRKKPRSFTGGF